MVPAHTEVVLVVTIIFTLFRFSQSTDFKAINSENCKHVWYILHKKRSPKNHASKKKKKKGEKENCFSFNYYGKAVYGRTIKPATHFLKVEKVKIRKTSTDKTSSVKHTNSSLPSH